MSDRVLISDSPNPPDLLTRASRAAIPFSEVGGVGEVNRSFNAEDEKARDSCCLSVVMNVAVYVCARYVSQNNCFGPCDLQQDPEDGYANLQHKNKKKLTRAYLKRNPNPTLLDPN